MFNPVYEIYIDPVQWRELCDIERINIKSEYLLIQSGNHFLKFIPTVHSLFQIKNEEFGTVELQKWKEGLALWVGGKMVWKSWVNI